MTKGLIMEKCEVEELLNPSPEEMAEILNLFKKIKGRTCTAKNYLDYLLYHWDNVAIFVVKKAGKIVAFTQAEAPGMLEPKTAWLPFSSVSSGVARVDSRKGLELAEVWMRGKGATKYKLSTVRHPRAMSKVWHMRRSNEVLMVKDL